MSKGTLLFYINSLRKGGAENVISQLAYRFSLEGYRSILVTSFVADGEYELPGGIERISIEREEIVQNRLKRNYSRIKVLRRLCKQYKPEVIISFMAEPNFRAIVATAGLPVKRIVSVRNDPNREYSGRIGKFVGKFLLPFADGCVFQTEDARQWFPAKLQKKSKVIFNAVSTRFFETTYVSGNNIITLGRLAEQKNHKMLIESFYAISDLYPDVNLDIFGVGPLESELKSLIRSLNLENRVFLRGLTKDSALELAKAKLFVLSSDYEGMPNALMEALAVGVPCISTDCPCGGPRLLIKNGENGLLVSVGNKEEMIMAIETVLRDDQWSMRMGKAAKESSSRYLPDSVFASWKAYIEIVIGSKRV